MKYNNIQEYVKTLSLEERELHKDLIQECSIREAENNKMKEKYDVLIPKLQKSTEDLYKGLFDLNQSVLISLNSIKNVEKELELKKAIEEGKNFTVYQ
jgi:hypothetical protein